jgi:hypothetical protein
VGAGEPLHRVEAEEASGTIESGLEAAGVHRAAW